MTKKEPELLLIATSVRVLLESARRGGYTAAVIDGFCDREVMQHARYAERVSLCADGRLDDAELAKAIKNTTERYAETLSAVIVGSGIEGCSAASDAIAQSGLQWLGNARTRYSSAERLTCHFGSDKLAAMPDDRPPYLYKSTTGNGGLHIYSDDQSAPKSDDYYRQSYLPFASISHLFIADGRRIETVGFSTQWHAKHDAAHPFCFGGAISSHDLDESCITQAGGYAETLGLRGLNNIDYLYDGEKLYFLELNPRPSATMILYDSDYPTGLLHAHISACRGEGLAQPERIAPEIRGFAILYADQRMHLPADFDWPDEATDVPVAQPQGYRIEKNTPICTLHAQAADAADVLTILQAQICALQNRMSALQTIPDYQQAR
ncbi:MAG: ATP-grasp domain-containing protein [Chromatiales bacterium]|nr:ATP-grasp domain-containing protein [Chromatiales bacterium]